MISAEKQKNKTAAPTLLGCSLLPHPLSTVNRIKEQYKVSVRIPQDSERSGLVRIEGDPKGVQLARRELMEMVHRMVRTGVNLSYWLTKKSFLSLMFTVLSCSQENERTKDLIVEQKFHRTIIGQKGEKIKEVRDKFPEVNDLHFILLVHHRENDLFCLRF